MVQTNNLVSKLVNSIFHNWQFTLQWLSYLPLTPGSHREDLRLHQRSQRWMTLHHCQPVQTVWAWSWKTQQEVAFEHTPLGLGQHEHTKPASPHWLALQDAVSFIFPLFTQLAQVHLCLQGHLKAAGVHHLQLQPQAWWRSRRTYWLIIQQIPGADASYRSGLMLLVVS